MGEFSKKVFDVVKQVPRGKVATYGQVARIIGSPRSARYVGYALRGNPEPGASAQAVPCHRIVFKDGKLCEGYAFGGPEAQRRMLEEEGVAFTDDGRVNLEQCLWNGFTAANESTATEDFPCAPPPDFDWKRELGED